MSFLRPRIPSEKGLGAHRERFDYSETHLAAKAHGKTTPELVCLPKTASADLAPLTPPAYNSSLTQAPTLCVRQSKATPSRWTSLPELR